jgi:hypothetical protein
LVGHGGQQDSISRCDATALSNGGWQAQVAIGSHLEQTVPGGGEFDDARARARVEPGAVAPTHGAEGGAVGDASTIVDSAEAVDR